MVFRDLTSAMHDVIKNTFSEADDVIYEPLSGGSFSFKGIFNDKYSFVDPQTQQVFSSNQPTVGVKAADMLSLPVKNDKLYVRNTRYRVKDSQEDGEGWLHLFLYLD